MYRVDNLRPHRSSIRVCYSRDRVMLSQNRQNGIGIPPPIAPNPTKSSCRVLLTNGVYIPNLKSLAHSLLVHRHTHGPMPKIWIWAPRPLWHLKPIYQMYQSITFLPKGNTTKSKHRPNFSIPVLPAWQWPHKYPISWAGPRSLTSCPQWSPPGNRVKLRHTAGIDLQ